MHVVKAYTRSEIFAIAAGGTKTAPISMNDFSGGMFVLPATFTGATVSFEVSADGVNFFPYHKSDNNLLSITVTQGFAYAFPTELFGAAWLKIVSASTETPGRNIWVTRKY